MSVVVFAEQWEGKFKKTTFEAVSYGRRVADMLGVPTVAVVIGSLDDDAAQLATYGASKVVHFAASSLNSFDSSAFASALKEVAVSEGAQTVVVSGTSNGKLRP